VHHLHPEQFNYDVPNPWRGVTQNRRTKATKPDVTREQAYDFAQTAIERGYPEIAAAAVVCFEWPSIGTGGRLQSKRLVVFNRNSWSPSPGARRVIRKLQRCASSLRLERMGRR
jgi:hypothetical protein